MSIVAKLTAIADALRNVLGTSGKYTLAQMPGLINSLSSNYKTMDIYCNIFKFDVAEYGESLVYNQYEEAPAYYKDGAHPKKKEYVINYYPNSPTGYFYYIWPTRAYDHRRLRAILPNMVDYTEGDTYADASGNGVEFEYVTLMFASFTVSLANFENLKLNAHFSFKYEDTEKTYSSGIDVVTQYNGYSFSNSRITNLAGDYQNLGYIEIRSGKLYLINGLSTSEPVEICSVDPGVMYDVVLQLTHSDTARDEYNKVVNRIEYSITLTDENDVSTEYTGTATYALNYGILHNTYNDSMIIAIYSPPNRPEVCHWYSLELAGKRYSNRLINPMVAYADDTLYEITDDNAPGMLTVHSNAFNPYYCTNLHRVNCSAVTNVADCAFNQESISVSDNNRSYKFHSQINEVVLPNATSIGHYAFRNRDSHDNWSSSDTNPHIAIAKLDIHNVTSIGQYAFYSALTNYFKPLVLNRLSSLGQYAFSFSTITEFKSTSLTSVPKDAFSNSYVLEKIDLPECTSVGENAFSNCFNLRYINMPKLTFANSAAFFGIFLHPGEGGRTINLPALTAISGSVFQRLNLGINGVFTLPELTELQGAWDGAFTFMTAAKINLPKLARATSYCVSSFGGIRNLKELRLPSFEGLATYYYGSDVFSGIVYKADEFNTDVIMPNLTTYKSGLFAGMTCAVFKSSNLTNPMSSTYSLFRNTLLNQIYLYNLPYLGYEAFEYSGGLELVYADKLYTLGESNGRHFYYCTHLKALILAGDEAVCTLSNTNAFDYCPIKGWTPYGGNYNNAKYTRNDGYIYVPRALIEDYKVAPNWSTFANKFRAIEDYGGLEGIKDLIYPKYTNTFTVSNADILADINNPNVSTLNTADGKVNAAISNTLKTIDLEAYTGDTTEYVVIDVPQNGIINGNRSRFFIPQLPAVKDFTLEFDTVALYNSFGVIFGAKRLPTDSSELTETYLRSPSSYLYWVVGGTMYNDVYFNYRYDYTNGRNSYIGTDDLTRTSNPGSGREDELKWGGNLCRDSGNSSSAIFYNGEKVHVKIVKHKREIRIYLNGMLGGSYVSDMVQSRPGGYFAMTTEDTRIVNCFGIANMTLKYNHVWTNPPATEVWISSVNWTDMTSTIDGVDTVLTKNVHDYYVLDISQLTGNETTWVLSSTDGTTSTLNIADLSTYGGKTVDVYGTTVTVYE